MKKSTLKNIIKEEISDMEVSLKLSDGRIIHGLARKKPKRLSLQIGSNTYFSFWEGKFTLSGTGSVTIVGGVDDYSHGWFLKATEEYLEAMHDTYPERFGPLKEGMFSKSPCNAKTLLEGLKTQFQIAFETGVESGGYDDFEKGFWRHNSNEILWKLEEILNR